MGKKITQYTAVTSTNPDTGSLLDVSEKSGSAYATKKWSLLQVKTWLATYLQLPFSSITSTPTTISGYGITDAVDTTGGTANYISKFTGTNTIEDSKLIDDSTNIQAYDIAGTSIIYDLSYTDGRVTFGKDFDYLNFNPGGGILSFSNNGGMGSLRLLNYDDSGWQHIGFYSLKSNGNRPLNGDTIASLGNMGHFNIQIQATENHDVATSKYGTQLVLSGTKNSNNNLTSNTLILTQDNKVRISDAYTLPSIDGSTGQLIKTNGSGTLSWTYFPCEVQLAVSDETTSLTTGAGKITFRMPYAMVLQEVRASLVVAGTTSGLTTIDINESGATILSTKLTIDLTEKTSTTASTPAVISDTALADDAEITIDIDAISGGATEKGLKVLLKGYRLL